MNKIPFPENKAAKKERCPEVHCRLNAEAMAKIAEIAEATGNSMNKTGTMLIETILPYITIETIMEPRKRVSMQLPGVDAKGEKACSTTD